MPIFNETCPLHGDQIVYHNLTCKHCKGIWTRSENAFIAAVLAEINAK